MNDKTDKKFIAKEVLNMKLTGDGAGNIMFNELLFAAMKRAIGNKIFS